MYIDTTININTSIFGMISRAVLLTGQPKNLIISSVMRRLADDYERLVQPWSRVRYQKRDAAGNWRLMHLSLKPDEYEFFLDLRKVFKFSVSCLIANAIEKYLDEILNKIHRGADNYWYENYMFSCVIVDGVICWILSWGVPRTLIAGHY